MTKVPCERAPDPALAPGRGFAVLGPEMWLKIRSFFRLLGSSEPETASLFEMTNLFYEYATEFIHTAQVADDAD